MLLSLLVLQLLWLASSVSPIGLDPTVLQCKASFQIPYPFGLINSSRPPLQGFEIICDQNQQGGVPLLPLGSGKLKIADISLHGYVRVHVRAVAWHCSSRSEELPPSPLSLEGTPYTFNDTANKFTVIGCDALALFKADSPSRTSGCASFCFDVRNVIDGSCSGVGCCQAAIPKGLKNFTLNFNSIRNLTGSLNQSPTGVSRNNNRSIGYNLTGSLSNSPPTCSKAYIVEQDGFRFSKQDLLSMEEEQFSRKEEELKTVVLDWAIGNETCKEATAKQILNPSSYACKDANSVCNDSASGVGYRCYCKFGYRGNPYLLDGCHDVDECTPPNINPCVSKCINTRGGFHCLCPLMTRGDGKKEGTGCKRIAPLEITLGVGLVLLIMLLTGSSWTYWVWKNRKVKKLREKLFIQNGGLLLQQHISSRQASARIFNVEELEKATEGFNESRVIGRGGNGTVYKGILPDQQVIAIKKSKLVDEGQIEDFINEVVILSQVNHRNVVKLLGCCLESPVPMLVYEYISNGTLFHHLHERPPSPMMSWENRLRIAIETAAALAYLHSATSTPIIHRDVKSANILLDEDYTAKVADFGASRLVPYDHTHVTTLVQGTWGYLDPEYFHTSQLTEKSDVYSFGVVLVELLIREKPVSHSRTSEGGKSLAAYFLSLLGENNLLRVIDPQTVEEASVRHILVVAELARSCLSSKGEERPTMKDVAVELDALRRLAAKQFVRRAPEKEELSVSASSDLHEDNKLKKYGPEASLLFR